MWIFIALAGYFFNALAAIIDKFLLHERIGKPVVYAFYVSMFSLVVLAFLPAAKLFGGFHFYGWKLLLASLLSGVIFEYALLAFYSSVKKSEITRVSPMVFGVIAPLALLVISFLFLGERLGVFGILGFIFLILAGGVISFDLPIRKKQFFAGFLLAVASGVLMAVSFALLKYTFATENFFSAFIWSRIGSFLGGVSFFAFEKFRHDIIANIFNFKEKKHPEMKNTITATMFVLNKALGGLAMLAINFAMFLGSASLVQSLGSAQFVFVFLLAAPLSLKHPHMYKEENSQAAWLQRIVSVIFIAAGLALISLEGKNIML